MVKSVIAVLFAAAAFVPAIASAQQDNHDNRGDAPHADQAHHDAYRAQRQQQGQPQRAPAQGQPQAQAQANAQFRQGQPQQGQPQQGQYQRGQYQQQGQYRQGQPGQYQQGQRPNGYGGQGGYTGRGDQGRPNFGPNAPGGQGGYAGRGYDNRGGQANRGNWNNGWHGDRRYDWNSYRAQNRGVFHLPRYYAPGGFGGYGYRRFSVGITLGYGFYGQNYWIGNPYDYRLPPAYGPYRWVRYYNDALLVDVRSGYVVDAVYGIFW